MNSGELAIQQIFLLPSSLEEEALLLPTCQDKAWKPLSKRHCGMEGRAPLGEINRDEVPVGERSRREPSERRVFFRHLQIILIF